MLKSIADELGVSLSWIESGNGPMRLDPGDDIDRLIASHHLPRETRAVVDAYLALNGSQQQAVLEYIVKLGQTLAQQQPAPTPDGWTAQDYHKTLDDHLAREEGETASSSTNCATA